MTNSLSALLALLLVSACSSEPETRLDILRANATCSNVNRQIATLQDIQAAANKQTARGEDTIQVRPEYHLQAGGPGYPVVLPAYDMKVKTAERLKELNEFKATCAKK